MSARYQWVKVQEKPHRKGRKTKAHSTRQDPTVAKMKRTWKNLVASLKLLLALIGTAAVIWWFVR